jgi:hypothetical protein
MIPVDYVVNQKAYREFIHNISSIGVFIGSSEKPKAGDKIVMTFSWKQPIKSTGTVVRTDINGFAVQFSHPLANALQQ